MRMPRKATAPYEMLLNLFLTSMRRIASGAGFSTTFWITLEQWVQANYHACDSAEYHAAYFDVWNERSIIDTYLSHLLSQLILHNRSSPRERVQRPKNINEISESVTLPEHARGNLTRSLKASTNTDAMLAIHKPSPNHEVS